MLSDAQTAADPVADILYLSLARRACLGGEARRLREAAGVGLREAARALEMDATQLSRWERGLAFPRGDRAVALGRMIAEIVGSVPVFVVSENSFRREGAPL